jgi:hypothetical protein
MNININVNITIEPATETVHTVLDPIAEELTLESIEERLHQAKVASAKAKLANHEAKVAMIVKRIAYRQRIADKLRTLFGDDTANRFLAGEF